MYNVIIADDEPVLRKGIMCFVNWDALDCKIIYEASSGLEAQEYLESNHVDIVLTDIKMPGMDGIQLTKYINEYHPRTKVIILTAYADFSYAQSAIKYNVVDFVVKTNPSEKIPEAINKAIHLINQQQENEEKIKQLENRINDNLSEICEKLLVSIINGIITDQYEINTKLKEVGIKLDNYFILMYDINSTSSECIAVSPEEQNKFLHSIKNFLSLAFKDYQHFTVIMSKDLLFTVVSFNNSHSTTCTQALLMTCNEILVMVDNFMKFTVRIGISEMHMHSQELPIAYNEAHEALSGIFYSDKNDPIYMFKNRVQLQNNTLPSYKYTDSILNSIQHGNHNTAITSLLKLFEEYKNTKVSVEQVIVSSMLLCSLCFRLLENYMPELPAYLKSELDVYKQIKESKSIQNIFNILCNAIKYISEFIASNENQYNYLVKEVNKYIRENYNKDITLQIAADYVHVNSSYLSRMYKKETGRTIIDTINNIRIDKAKVLLKDPAKKIFEVAAEVGIEDPAYFTHVFEKYTGISPKEYKSK